VRRALKRVGICLADVTHHTQVAFARHLVDHPRFQMVPGMLVRFREEDGTWTKRRFRDFYDFVVLPVAGEDFPFDGEHFPADCAHYRERFDLFLNDPRTAVIVLAMAMGYGWEFFRERYTDLFTLTRGREWWTNDLGTVSAGALLATWDREARPSYRTQQGAARDLPAVTPRKCLKSRAFRTILEP